MCIYPKYTISTITIFRPYKSLQFDGDAWAADNSRGLTKLLAPMSLPLFNNAGVVKLTEMNPCMTVVVGTKKYINNICENALKLNSFTFWKANRRPRYRSPYIEDVFLDVSQFVCEKLNFCLYLPTFRFIHQPLNII